MGRSHYSHGHSCNGVCTRTYRAWTAMKARCDNPRHQSYKNYGGRGIKYCKGWERFETFLADMGVCPEGLELERVNNDLGYFPSNCKWDTSANQNRNKRGCRKLEIEGKTVNFCTEANRRGIPTSTALNRVARGWSPEKAITTPPEVQPKVIHFNGVSKNLSEWARHIGITPSGLCARLSKGWSIEKSLTQPATQRT